MSEAPLLAYPDITYAALLTELEREQAYRRSTYAGQVEKGRMVQEEADRELAIAAAWAEDVQRIRSCWTGPGPAIPSAPKHKFTWRDRRVAVLRELDFRQRFYPQWISGGRMTADQAEHRLRCMTALRDLYEQGWDWRSDRGESPHFGVLEHDPAFTPEMAEARQQWANLRSGISAREGTVQEEMFA